MTKQEIFDSFDGYFSKKGIVTIDDENRLVGKYCQLAPLDNGEWDLWIGWNLSVRSLNCKLALLPSSWPFVRLNGEAYVQIPLNDFKSQAPLLQRVLGVRKRKIISEEHKAKMKMFKSGDKS